MSSESQACILQFNNHFRAAISAHEMKQLVVNPQLYKMPNTPVYCSHVFPWYNQLLPSMDISIILTNKASIEWNPKFLLVVSFYCQLNNCWQYAGLVIDDNPMVTTVYDTQGTDLPKHPYIWKTIAHSCFEYANEKIPILNLSLLFSEKFRQLAQAFLKHRANRVAVPSIQLYS